MAYPRMFRVRQHFEGPHEDNVAGAVRREWGGLGLEGKIRAGESVAITAGSRGIANIALILREASACVREMGAVPVIVPAMGSHGGGTAEGQRKIIESYGITEEYTGAEIRASMETVVLAETGEGIPVHFDRHAFEADHVIVCGRIKPHTGFVGEIESGLMKMMLIGLGKHAGATIYHRAILDYSFAQIVRSVAGIVLNRGKVAAGLGIVENGYDETALIAGVRPEEFESREKQLLVQAKQWMPRLPFREIDLLIVDSMGKNISGSGMDTNVIGRKYHGHSAAADEYPKVKRIFVRGLTPETHGNACGIGLAEFCTTRLVEDANWEATYINSLTGGHPAAATVPIHFTTDRAVLDAALPIGLTETAEAQVVRIANTLELGEVEVSEAFVDEVESRRDLTAMEAPREMGFDANGNLVPLGRGGQGTARRAG